MRKAVYNLVTTDTTLQALLPAGAWYERGSVPDAPEGVFGVLAWQGGTPSGPGRRVTRLTVWVYQPRGSYDVIDDALKRVDEIFQSVAQYEFDGQRIAQMDYEGSSVDLFDDVYRCNARNAGYRVFGSGL